MRGSPEKQDYSCTSYYSGEESGVNDPQVPGDPTAHPPSHPLFSPPPTHPSVGPNYDPYRGGEGESSQGEGGKCLGEQRRASCWKDL